MATAWLRPVHVTDQRKRGGVQDHREACAQLSTTRTHWYRGALPLQDGDNDEDDARDRVRGWALDDDHDCSRAGAATTGGAGTTSRAGRAAGGHATASSHAKR